MNNITWKELLSVIKGQVLPALGCTEPVSLALAAATASEKLNTRAITKVEAFVSPNLMKNGMGVTVPGTGMVGLPIAAAVGVTGGEPNAGLEVLKNVTTQQVAQAKHMLAENLVSVKIAPRCDKGIYAEVSVFSNQDYVKVIIEDSHTNIVFIEKNGNTLYQKNRDNHAADRHHDVMLDLSVKSIFEFATNIDFDEIKFILDSAELNNELSQEGLLNRYGLQIAATLKQQINLGFLADDLLSKIMIRTTAASDARMGGATLPAMSNSGSGNQGITATMPVVVVADYIDATQEQLARALILSHTIAIYIHSKFPALSALCAASTAAMGAAAGMAWLLSKEQYQPIEMAICNMIGDVSGIICDGASNSCAMKVSTSVSSAFKAVLMALSQIRVTGSEGIVCHCVEHSINNLGSIASNGMKNTDTQIINIMSHKAL